MSGWLKKAIGSPSQARRVIAEARNDVAEDKPKNEVAAQREKNQAKGGKR